MKDSNQATAENAMSKARPSAENRATAVSSALKGDSRPTSGRGVKSGRDATNAIDDAWGQMAEQAEREGFLSADDSRALLARVNDA